MQIFCCGAKKSVPSQHETYNDSLTSACGVVSLVFMGGMCVGFDEKAYRREGIADDY